MVFIDGQILYEILLEFADRSEFLIYPIKVVVLVAWLGGKGNRARWVAGGGILVAIGTALFTLPQWISKPYTPSGTDINNLGKFFVKTFFYDLLDSNNIHNL